MAETPRFVSREDFNTNDRSRELRAICVEILRRAKVLLLNDAIADDADVRLRLHAEMKRLGGQLLSLGIVENIHCGEAAADFSDPVTLAENLAGYVIQLTSSNLRSRKNTAPIVEEFSLEKITATGARHDVLDAETMPTAILEFNEANCYLNAGARLFDAEEEVFDADPQ